MLLKDKSTKISKTLSYVLRHNPASAGIELDDNGWALVSELLLKLRVDGKTINFETLKYVVDTNNKKRFSFNEDFTSIRASQGHSIKIDLNYCETKPPAILYHGTAEKFLSSILKTGLQRMNRHHVHLSLDAETAFNVGQRHGKPVILKIDAAEMYKAGHVFYVSENNVWLTENVPEKYIGVMH
jgi:putative RNA 2'-phosphotransferase